MHKIINSNRETQHKRVIQVISHFHIYILCSQGIPFLHIYELYFLHVLTNLLPSFIVALDILIFYMSNQNAIPMGVILILTIFYCNSLFQLGVISRGGAPLGPGRAAARPKIFNFNNRYIYIFFITVMVYIQDLLHYFTWVMFAALVRKREFYPRG
jgi:hypothetical protein